MGETTKKPDGSPTYVLVPGAGGSAWYWHRVVEELSRRGQEAVAVELPAGDEAAGIKDYADAVIKSIDGRNELIVVAQSMGAFSAPLICDRVQVDLLVLVNAMVPAPGESAGDWWANTGHAHARVEQAARDGRSLDDDPDLLDTFFHDVPPAVTAEAMAMGAPEQSGTPFGEPWPLDQWPDVATKALVGGDDRFFPPEFQRRLLQERLGITPQDVPGGHLVALSRPKELVDWLERFAGLRP